ncbi:MAG: ATP synthase F1 subunit delta [Chitinophagaceae bacterium]
MQNPKLAARYAKSLMDLAIEKNQLDAVYADMQAISSTCKESKDFLSLVKSPVIKADSKLKIVHAIFSGHISELSHAFMNLIIQKGREFFLPEIATAFIQQYKKKNSINEVILTTADPLDEATKQNLVEKIQAQFKNMSIDLSTKIDPSIVGGFILEANNNLFDASILRDLKDIKKQFLKNEYIPDIR